MLAISFVPSHSVAETPNVILVMCDDLGYGDLKCFNEDSPITTPNIDAMAASGLKFTRFYAASSVCSPTRGSCLTGRNPSRYGISSANVGHLKKDEITLPELLKQRGYTTGHFGKWHLGTLTTTVKDSNRGRPGETEHFSPPSQHGFDENFSTEAKVPTFDPMLKPLVAKANTKAWDAIVDKSTAETYGTRYWNHDGSEATEKLDGDNSRIIMDRAIPFIETAVESKQPFFAAVWFHSPHLPVVAPPEIVKQYDSHDLYARNYFGCVTAMDLQIGRLRQKLRHLGVADNTMIWFCSDNGPEGGKLKAPGSAGPFRGRKRSLCEGGVRVPGILEWPGHVQAGETNVPCVTSDYLPTVLEIVGAEYPDDRPLDGVSLAPMIADEAAKRGKPIGFRHKRQIAWHEGNSKLYSANAGNTWELYDLVADPGETNDLSTRLPDQTKRMIASVKAWMKSCEASNNEQDY